MSTTVHQPQHHHQQQPQHHHHPAGSGSSSAPTTPTRPRSVSVKHVRVEADEARGQHQQHQHQRAAAPTATTNATHNNNNSSSQATGGSSKARVSHINVGDERLHLALIQLLGCVLAQLVAFEEQQYPGGRGSISMFHTAYVPSISIGAYLRRVALYTKVSSEVLLQSVLHVHQLMQRDQAPLVVNSLNVHRLLLTSILTTAKFFDDAHYNNAYFSYVGGVPLRELNALEVEFLSLLNFDFFVHTSTYQFFYNMCRERSIHQGGCACPSHLEHVPDTVAVAEYRPDADVDFSVPIEAATTTATAEPAAAIAAQQHQLGTGSMRALNDAIRTIVGDKSTPSIGTERLDRESERLGLDESFGSTDTESEELLSASATATPAQHHAHSRTSASASTSAASASSGATKTPRQHLHVQHYAPPQQHQHQQQRSSSPASYTSSCFPGSDSPISSTSSLSSLSASYLSQGHSRAHTSHAVPSVLSHMQSPSTSRSVSVSVSASAGPASLRHRAVGHGTLTATATPRAADSMQHTPTAHARTYAYAYTCAADTPTASAMMADADTVLKEKHERIGLGLNLTPRMSVVPQEQ